MAGIFILIQIILLIDFAYDWDNKWHTDNIDEGYRIWDYLLVICSGILILFSIAMIVIEIIIFGSGASCHLNRFFIISTLILGIISIIASLVARRGITPPSVVCAFCSFICWTALLSDPNKQCNLLQTVASDTVSQIFTIIFGIAIAAFSLLRSAISTGSSFKKLFKFLMKKKKQV